MSQWIFYREEMSQEMKNLWRLCAASIFMSLVALVNCLIEPTPQALLQAGLGDWFQPAVIIVTIGFQMLLFKFLMEQRNWVRVLYLVLSTYGLISIAVSLFVNPSSVVSLFKESPYLYLINYSLSFSFIYLLAFNKKLNEEFKMASLVRVQSTKNGASLNTVLSANDINSLEQLHRLKTTNILSESEYDIAKGKILKKVA
jgi:hypothetical protein